MCARCCRTLAFCGGRFWLTTIKSQARHLRLYACCADITRITECRPISRPSTYSTGRSRSVGDGRCCDAASAGGSTGCSRIGSLYVGFLPPALCILGRKNALLSELEIRAQCGNSARWDPCGWRSTCSASNRPYRDRVLCLAAEAPAEVCGAVK